MPAVEIWQLDDVKYFFEASWEQQVDADLNHFLGFLQDSAKILTFCQTALALKTPTLKSDPVFVEISKVQKEMQE